MEEGEEIVSAKRSTILIMIMGVIFALRGGMIFPPYHAHPAVTIFDIGALILTGIFLTVLTIRNYSKKSILLVGLLWFLPLFRWVWYFVSIWYFFQMLPFFGVELLFPMIVFSSWIGPLIIWEPLKKKLKPSHYSIYVEKFKLQPEIIVALLIVILIILALPLPRLSYNSISYDYRGDGDVINAYLQLEFQEYFPEIKGLVRDTCTGWASFDLVPNYMGVTEREVYTNAILSSNYRAKFQMGIHATTTVILRGQEIIHEVDSSDYRYGAWNNSFHDLYLVDMTFFTNATWQGEQIYIIKENIEWDNMVGTDMLFHQFVAFYPGNNSLITILSGYEIECYD
ncbi:MAG: hypothetical protein JSW11_10340 [Candidatus Heimdallarchaeota archaeon]|nr:MAG: hypothetical protein JSW11_10340 [Candidatus Heimdallarchaeota archaeon]